MKTPTFRPWARAAAALSLCLAGATAQASVVVTFTQMGGQVKAVVEGSFDTSFFTYQSTRPYGVAQTRFNSLGLSMGPASGGYSIYVAGQGGFAPFASSVPLQAGSFDGGDVFVFANVDFGHVWTDYLYLPFGYQSGAELHSAATWNGSFSSLGLIPTTAVTRLNGDQTITVNFVDANATVPEPASLALTALALTGLGLSRRARRGGAHLPQRAQAGGLLPRMWPRRMRGSALRLGVQRAGR